MTKDNEPMQTIASVIVLKQRIQDKQIPSLVQKLGKMICSSTKPAALFLIDAEAVASLTHLHACIHYAQKSFQQKHNIAETFAAEVMLFLSGHRQISKAIAKVGINSKTKRILCVQTQPTTNKKSNAAFDFVSFLQKNGIQISHSEKAINSFMPVGERKIMTNLGITEEELLLLVSAKCSRVEALEKLAIERSALLNIEK